ncbi:MULTISPECIES: LutC/YkgG family protein [unclassified Streptomyces]|uniref:LutC/YkgG family protein n=1 Tax=unclassified Streptomyces TaxID=2593676 RepID=UPI00225467A2|nr:MULTISPECIES: lactate utilization protein C [unclassified Streptomyces]MCX5052226.1 lactate utilization protein C [Streptomyces sp. NBC_00474]MCX5063974.1 lactate utilization protein C [Streptomyces sp. NBC_00452]MCX5251399.1 lactate utilization protein C [Streptomyces sp. NBC_00201]MCX5294677.1 lactate utilization protein C [Streptomyces sp. NBC_00183]
MSSRERILGRVQRALADVGQDDTPYEQAVPREYLREHGERSVEQTVDLLAENLADYRAIVHRCTEGELAALIGRLLAERGSKTVLVPTGLDEEWLGATDAERVPDRGESTPHELDRVDSVVTACAVAIAETGTIVLDGGPDQGRRRITLVPDHHICVVRVPDQVVSAVPQALERLDPARPLTWISGPSATSDIELDRVEGVHGPRSLEVVLVSGRPDAEVTP